MELSPLEQWPIAIDLQPHYSGIKLPSGGPADSGIGGGGAGSGAGGGAAGSGAGAGASCRAGG